MNIILAILVLMSFPAKAGWLRNFCLKHLVAEHPYPYADEPFSDLIDYYKRTHESKVLDEILYRLRSDLLTHAEKRLFWETFR